MPEFTIPENIFAEKHNTSEVPTQRIVQLSILMPTGSSLDCAAIVNDFGQVVISPQIIWQYLNRLLVKEFDNLVEGLTNAHPQD